MTQKKKYNPLSSFGRLVLGLFGIKSKDNMKEAAVASPSTVALKNFFSNPVGVVGLFGFIIILATVLIGQKLIEFDPYYSQGVLRNLKPGFGYMSYPSELEAQGVKDIASGVSYSIGLSEAGNVFIWGKDYDKATQMPDEAKEAIANEKVQAVAAGDRHTFIVTESGKFFGWGNNEFDQCNIDNATAKALGVAKRIEREGVKKMIGGDQISSILTNQGNLMVWGSTRNSKLDRIPARFEKNVDDYALAPEMLIVLLKDGTLDSIGGRGSAIYDKFPERYKDGSVKINKVAMTAYSAAVVLEDGTVEAWGSAVEGTLVVPDFGGEKVVDLKAGRTYFTAMTESGKLYTWGKDNYGEVKNVPSGTYKNFFCQHFQNYAVSESGKLDKWGLNGFVIGSDNTGRNLWIRLVHGGKITMKIAAASVTISLLIGVTVGMISGFYGGIVDNLLMRFTEIVASLPFLPLVITLSAILPPETTQSQRLNMIMVILGVLGWTGIARLVRGQILSEREKDYILAARALGLKENKIMLSHILPNIISIIIVQATIGFASNLLTEAGLSFLGFGVQVPFPSWGNMMTNAQSTEVIRQYWWRWIFPALAVFLTALTVNLMGDGIRDAIDPKANDR